jgi:hypothetical protein
MTIGHWTAAVVAAALLGACTSPRNDSGSAAGTGGTTSGATSTMTDTTMTGGQGGMADTSMGGMHDSSRMGTSDTTRP